MKRLIISAGILVACSGCTFHRNGSQAIDFNFLNWGRSEAAVTPTDGLGADGRLYDKGTPWNQR